MIKETRYTEKDAMRVVIPNKAIRFCPFGTTTLLVCSLLSLLNNSGKIAKENTIVYAIIPNTDNGISIVPICNEAYGPCNTSLHDDDEAAPFLLLHSAAMSDAPPPLVYCNLS